MNCSVVILAAGQSTRMRSNLPKVLHPIGGIPILKRIVNTAKKLAPSQVIVVYGHQGALLKEALHAEEKILFAEQSKQQGTGHAVQQALPFLSGKEDLPVLILCGDVPLITEKTLHRLLENTTHPAMGFVTVKVDNPKGLGRVIRNERNQVIGIVEEKDATEAERAIQEINTGIFLVSKTLLEKFLPKISSANAQGEYYLTDLIKLAVMDKIPITTVSPDNEFEVLGINDRVQLAELERIYQREMAYHLMKQGVTIIDPARFDVRGELTVGEDVTIDVNVILQGKVRIGNQVTIGPNVIIKHAEIHDGANILANSVIEGAVIGAGCIIGPFARIRPGTELSVNVHIGNFVEMKNAVVGPGSKINHLSYIGDASLGQEVNVGAGTITCNYDGKNKHQTTIGDYVFIGSDTQLIAPVKLGDRSVVGAGTTVVKDVEANELVHNRIEQRTVKNWARKTNSE